MKEPFMSAQTQESKVTPLTSKEDRPRRGIPPQGEGGYDECWYPIALSSEVETGKAISQSFLDGRVVVFRGEDGVTKVLSPFCRHLGADLSVGEVIGNEIRCAFHHWKYDREGACTHIPSTDRIPKTARLFDFPTAEKWGLIWAFNGLEPTYDLPYFQEAEENISYHTVKVPEHPVDHWSLLSNSVDFQHLRFVHGLEFDAAPEDLHFSETGLEYPMAFIDPNMGRMEQYIKVFGTNVITLSGSVGGMPSLSMFAGTPIPGGFTRGYTVSATRKDAGPEDQVNMIIDMTEKFFLQLIEDDTPIQNSLRFREDHLVDGDQALGRFFEYLRKYPRSHHSQDFIT
jgi:phenylpropionate dioxygenase-like ring-hydroxylating dioxygenase large terminal subunit